jgi:hypothetical protein
MKLSRMQCIMVLLVIIGLLLSHAAFTQEAQIITEDRKAGNVTIHIDAVLESTDKEQFPTLTVAARDWNVTKLIALFWPEAKVDDVLATQDIIDEGIAFDGKDVRVETYCINGASLSVNYPLGRVFFQSRTVTEWQKKYSSVINKYMSDNNFSDFSGYGPPVDDWPLTSEFVDPIAEICTLDDAVAWSLALADSLDIKIDPNPISYTGVEERIHDEQRNETYAYNTIGFAVIRNGVRCETRDYFLETANSMRSLNAETLAVTFDANGLSSVSCQAYDELSSGEPQPVIYSDAALDSLADLYKMIISDSAVNIKSITFAYVLTPIPGKMLEFNYIPAWKFGTERESWFFNGIIYGDIIGYVNALNAQIIPSGYIS